MRFQEPGEEFEIEISKKTDLKTKIRIFTLFICFLGIIFIIAKNNFDFNFIDNDQIKPTCGPANTRKSTDDVEYALEKARRALEVNEQNFEKIPGYIEGVVAELPIGYKGSLRPVLKITFSEDESIGNKIPEEICGFDVQVYCK